MKQNDEKRKLVERNTGKLLPPDPDEMNERRAAWADAAIRAFRREVRTDIEDAVCDLLTDLMHWCDQNNQRFNIQLGRARTHYMYETDDIDETEG